MKVNVYIDESGAFVVPRNRDHLVCCVAGLVIPTQRETDVFFEFLRVRDRWPANPVELKGSQLDEAQTASVISLLADGGALLRVVATDMTRYDAAAIDAFKRDQTSRILRHITPEHQPSLVAQLTDLRDRWLATSDQLFVQSVLTLHLLEELLQTATLFYSLREPAELGSFRWTVDAKDRALTKVESIWKTLLLPFLQTSFMKKPFMCLREGDPYFREFLVDEDTPDERMRESINWLRSVEQAQPVAPRFEGVNLNRIFSDLTFAPSRESLGLQLADIVASACTRAFNGKLEEEGWDSIGALLVARDGPPIQFIELATDPATVGSRAPLAESLASVLRRIEPRVRSLWP